MNEIIRKSCKFERIQYSMQEKVLNFKLLGIIRKMHCLISKDFNGIPRSTFPEWRTKEITCFYKINAWYCVNWIESWLWESSDKEKLCIKMHQWKIREGKKCGAGRKKD